jgi:hypothetical protein
MKRYHVCQKVKWLVSGLSLSLVLCAMPLLAQSGSDTGSGSSASGSSGGTTSSGTTQNGDTRRDNGFNPGWLGLLGLVGLSGLRKPQHTHEVTRTQQGH